MSYLGSYLGKGKPETMPTKQNEASSSDRAAEVHAAIENDEAKGASEAKMAAEDKKEKLLDKQKDKLEKIKKKTHFPPGLQVSEKAKAKMEEKQAEIEQKLAEKLEKKLEQEARWAERPKVKERWQKLETKQQEIKDRILEKWEEQDKKRAEKRAEKLEKLADHPEAAQKAKERFAEEDVNERLYRAKYMAKLEERQLRDVKRREHAQVRRDKFYNFFAGFLGWQRRQIPEIPASTLADWALEGFESTEGQTSRYLVIIIAVAIGLYLFHRRSEATTS